MQQQHTTSSASDVFSPPVDCLAVLPKMGVRKSRPASLGGDPLEPAMSTSTPTPVGEDLLVYLEGEEETPVAVALKEKLTRNALKAKYGGRGKIVYLVNKNLQSFPTQLQGAVMWIPSKGIVAVVKASKNIEALVYVLHPQSLAGSEIEIEDLRLTGGFLEQILGPQVAPFHQEFRKKDIYDGSLREVVTLVDNDGCVKMSIQGPDIVLVQHSGPTIKWKDNPWVTQKTSKLPKKPKKTTATTTNIKSHRSIWKNKNWRNSKKNRQKHRPERNKCSKSQLRLQQKAPVETVYVYRANGDGYKCKNGGKEGPVFSVPIGPAISTGNIRYVCKCLCSVKVL